MKNNLLYMFWNFIRGVELEGWRTWPARNVGYTYASAGTLAILGTVWPTGAIFNLAGGRFLIAYSPDILCDTPLLKCLRSVTRTRFEGSSLAFFFTPLTLMVFYGSFAMDSLRERTKCHVTTVTKRKGVNSKKLLLYGIIKVQLKLHQTSANCTY